METHDENTNLREKLLNLCKETLFNKKNKVKYKEKEANQLFKIATKFSRNLSIRQFASFVLKLISKDDDFLRSINDEEIKDCFIEKLRIQDSALYLLKIKEESNAFEQRLSNRHAFVLKEKEEHRSSSVVDFTYQLGSSALQYISLLAKSRKPELEKIVFELDLIDLFITEPHKIEKYYSNFIAPNIWEELETYIATKNTSQWTNNILNSSAMVVGYLTNVDYSKSQVQITYNTIRLLRNFLNFNCQSNMGIDVTEEDLRLKERLCLQEAFLVEKYPDLYLLSVSSEANNRSIQQS